MARIWLAYFPGSPFARMARVLIREWALPVAEVEYPFPPTPDLFEVNPLGTVPTLIVDEEAIFPTVLVMERLWAMANRPDAAYSPERDRQVLLTILQAGDALVSALYQRWAGLGPVGTNHIGYDPAERHLARVGSTLAWLEHKRQRGHLADGITLPGVAVACLVLWAEARGGLGWRVPPAVERLVRTLEPRESLARTRPQPWSPA